jgi:hypothetical protein
MATYNLHYTKGMAQSQSVDFFENISSAIGDDSLIDSGTLGSSDNKTILFTIRGRKTNWIRSVCAIGTISEGTFRPTYDHNKRWWKLRLTFLYPTSSSITNYDVKNSRLQGTFVAPVNETYDITLSYGVQDLRSDVNTPIEGINIVLKVSVDNTFDYIETDNPVSFYTEYSDNDLTAKNTGASISPDRTNESGLPVKAGSGSSQVVDIQTDAQYGTQTWTPNY